ncbi:transcription termination factor Rho [Rubritalea tangerina]|uniref:Transcription termination factor Rho n=1 Tax=Rubritalea tangerina TaxID=430798 RepID=A0ABW4ZFM2_9BACT
MSEEASMPEETADTKVVAKKATKKVAKKAAKKTAKKAAKKTTAKKAAKKTATKKTAKKATKKTAKKAVKKVAKSEAAPEPVEATPVAQAATPPAEPAPKPTEENLPSPTPQVTQAAEPVAEKTQTKDEKPNQRRRHRNGRVEGGGPTHKHDNRNNRRNQKGKNNRRNNKRRDHKSGNQQDSKPVELTGPPVEVSGILELSPKGFGFLRELASDLEQSSNDVFISPDIVRVHGLRVGVWIEGFAKQGPRGLQITEVKAINGMPVDKARKLPHFDELKAVNPDKRIPFETESERFTTRVLDIMAPIGRGQRGLIVSPPRSGKTTMMLHMAEAVREKYSEEMHLMILLVDERPEEVTEFKMSLPGAEIYASSNDAGAKNHCRVAELCIERAKRLVEAGEHVFLMMDSITRLARAYNNVMGGSKKGKGRGVQSGGIVSGALEMPRRLFAAARNTRNAGSLTIVATALVHTNSRADEAIFQEFKGTGNMELVLDRRIAEQYIYPAVDIFKSGTRREELLLPEHMLHKIHLIRRGLSGARPHEAMERLLFFLKRFHNNAQMLLEIKG